VLCYALAGLTAAARLVNVAHYVSDVVAGGVLGVLGAQLLDRVARRMLDRPTGPGPTAAA
jgi:membrane-associated phospholipid phosphatase